MRVSRTEFYERGYVALTSRYLRKDDMPDPVLPKHRMTRLVRTQVLEPPVERGEFFTAVCACGEVRKDENAESAKAVLMRHIIDGEVETRAKELMEETIATGKRANDEAERQILADHPRAMQSPGTHPMDRMDCP